MESKNILDIKTTIFGNIKSEPESGMKEGIAFSCDWRCSCRGSIGGGEIISFINLEMLVSYLLGTFQGGSFMMVWNSEKAVWKVELNLAIITLS